MKQKEKMPLGEAIIKALEVEKVEHIFGLVGSHVLDVFEALKHSSIKTVTSKHEANASFMAEAYARVSGRVGVTVVTAGPGVLNGMNGIAQAQFSATPVIRISGAVPTNAEVHELHATNQPDYTARCSAPLCKASLRPEKPEDVLTQLSDAFRIARTYPQGPVHFEVPIDLFKKEANVDSNYIVQEVPGQLVSQALVDELIENCAIGASTIFALDKGVPREFASEICVDLAERIGARIVVTRDGIGTLPSAHPLFCGILDTFVFGEAAFDAVAAANTVVAVGFDHNGYSLNLLKKHSKGHLMEVGTRLVALGSDCVHQLPDSIGETMQRVAAAFPKNHGQTNHTASANINEFEKTRLAIIAKAQEREREMPLHPGWVMAELARSIKIDTTVVHDVGLHEIWARSVLPVTDGKSHIGSSTWASMGYSIPGSIGARMALDDRRIVAVVGDGCLLMSLNDLVTVAEVGGPTTIIVINDSEYNLISHVQMERHGSVAETGISEVDFSAIAIAMGLEAVRVKNPVQYRQALNKASEMSRPFLIEVITTPIKEMPFPS
ncbi:MAG: thiamine pyrophosphate-binding protein [Rhizobiaceae bacterium]|nr:thiamine pyrophosphate-binding protein [Rhizobiaceae bacterium]